MALPNISGLDLEELKQLRAAIDQQMTQVILKRRAALMQQIHELDAFAKEQESSKKRTKYRSPDGHTWTGKGRIPLWLKTLEAAGKSRKDFLVK